MTLLLDGTKIADQIVADLKKKIKKFLRPPGLAFLIVGDDPASHTYVAIKQRRCEEIGIKSYDQHFGTGVTREELLQSIASLNEDPAIDGIVIQQPLPRRFLSLIEAVDVTKDVDGFHPSNMGKLLLGIDGGIIPCTPLAIHHLLFSYGVLSEGSHLVIVNRSFIVGKPLAALFLQKNPMANATVTIAHSGTRELSRLTASADILVVAVGIPFFLQPNMVKKGAVVVDVGINRIEKRIVGDVDFDRVAPLASYITAVPGGVGPMTVAMLMKNTVDSYERRSFSGSI